MQKKYHRGLLSVSGNGIKQKIHSVPLVLIIQILILFTSVQAVSGQTMRDKRITLKTESQTIKSIFTLIEKQTGFTIGYDNILDVNKKTVLNVNNKTVYEVLLQLVGENYKADIKQVDTRHVLIKVEVIKTPQSPNVPAGQGPGTIKGRIVEFESSQPLPGASIYIVELKRGMQSDNDGYYKFSNIPTGIYTLKVTYISYKTESIQAEVKEGKEKTYDIKLQASNSLSEVVISGTAKRRGPVAHASDKQVLLEIKNSQSIVSGISSQQISMSADRNAAEVVKKISGVTVRDDKFIIIRGMNERYNLTYLNGTVAPSTELYSRAFSLDLIPTRIIDKILVYKSPAPDLLGDMSGGAVKIYTKDASSVKHLDIELQTGYRQNTTFNKNFLSYLGSGTDFLGFDNGVRKLPTTVPGFGNLNKALLSQATYAGSFSNILNYNKKSPAPLAQFTLNYYDSFKLGAKKLSSLTSFSYKNDNQHADVTRLQGKLFYPENVPGTSIENNTVRNYTVENQNNETAQLSLLQNFSFKLKDSSNLSFKNFILQQGQKSTVLNTTKKGQTVDEQGNWVSQPGIYTPSTRNIILSYTQRFLYSGNFGGLHYWDTGKSKLDWNTGYTYSKLVMPDQRIIRLRNNDQHREAAGDRDLNWTADTRGEDYERLGNKLDLGIASRSWMRNVEHVYNGGANYSYEINPLVKFKGGMYQSWKQRSVFRRVYTLNEGDLNSNGNYHDIGKPQIGADGAFFDPNLVFFAQQDLGKVWSDNYLRDDGSGLKVFDRTSGSDAYVATEQNNSIYAALSFTPFLGKLDIYGGLRVEYNRQRVAGAITAMDFGGIGTPILADLKSTAYLPSINIGYRPNKELVFRGAFGKTVNRPEFRELSPYSELDFLNNQYIKGNPSLISAKINNYDLRVEWYPNNNAKGETVSIAAFLKQIQNPIERTIYRDLYFDIAGNIGFQNADKAIVRGLEIDLRKNLDFIPLAFFRNISLTANGSWIYSHATRLVDSTISETSDANYNSKIDRQLQGQSPYSVNVGLSYDNPGLGTKISFICNQVGPRIYAASTGKPAYYGVNNVPLPGSQGSLIELTRKQLDFSFSQRIVKSLQAKFSVQNILDSPIQIAEDANFTYKYEKQELPPEDGKLRNDILATDYKTGRFFLLTLSYSF